MKILFTELARAELIDSIAYYEMDVPGLGETFKDEVASATMRISQFPQACKRGDVRKCIMHKFPYKVLYSIEEDHILIIAIAHQHRNPITGSMTNIPNQAFDLIAFRYALSGRSTLR